MENTPVSNGVLGSVLLVVVIVVAYLIVTKKSPWSLNQIPNSWGGKKWILIAASVVVAVSFVVWPSLVAMPSLKPPPLKTVWERTQEYGLWIVLILSIIFVLLYFLPKIWKGSESEAKTLRGVVIALAVALFVGVPTVDLIWGEKTPSKQVARSSEIPLASSPQSTWPKLVIPAGGRSERILYTPDMNNIRLVIIGNNYEFTTVYPDGSECTSGKRLCPSGPQTGAYVTNLAKETNIVAYAFASGN